MGVKILHFSQKRLTMYHLTFALLRRKENYQGKAYQRFMASRDFLGEMTKHLLMPTLDS